MCHCCPVLTQEKSLLFVSVYFSVRRANIDWGGTGRVEEVFLLPGGKSQVPYMNCTGKAKEGGRKYHILAKFLFEHISIEFCTVTNKQRWCCNFGG